MLSLLVAIEKGTDEEKLQQAIAYYVKRYEHKPQVCGVNRKTLSDDFSNKTYRGVEIRFDESIKIGDFMMVVE